MAPLTVLILIFPGINTLDVNGPLEVLCNWAIRSDSNGKVLPAPYKILIAASTPWQTSQAWEFVRLSADISFAQATTMIQENKIDVLIVPGFAPGTVGQGLINSNDEIFVPMNAFLNQENAEGKERWMISICVGAVLMNQIGAFNGRKATSHFGQVKAWLDKGNQKADWVYSRWVDGGTTENNVRILSSGGISCGIDCMLWFVSQTLDLKSAQNVAYMMDYAWNGGPPAPIAPTKQLP